MEQQRAPVDVHPRVLIQAIQDNLGITKKEISERTGISYGTLNRYTRSTAPVGRPRRRSIERLTRLYHASLNRFIRSGDPGRSGADYKPSLLPRATGYPGLDPGAGTAASLDALDLKGLDRTAVGTFLRRLAGIARDDLAHFRAAGFRDRHRLHESREVIGDLYVALLNDLSDAAAPPPPATRPPQIGRLPVSTP